MFGAASRFGTVVKAHSKHRLHALGIDANHSRRSAIAGDHFVANGQRTDCFPAAGRQDWLVNWLRFAAPVGTEKKTNKSFGVVKALLLR